MYNLTQIIIIFTLAKISETVRQRSTFSITWFKLSHNYCVKKHPAFFFLFHLLAFVAFTQPLFTQLPFYTTLKNYTTLFKKNYTTLFTQHFFTQPICSVQYQILQLYCSSSTEVDWPILLQQQYCSTTAIYCSTTTIYCSTTAVILKYTSVVLQYFFTRVYILQLDWL